MVVDRKPSSNEVYGLQDVYISLMNYISFVENNIIIRKDDAAVGEHAQNGGDFWVFHGIINIVINKILEG